MIKTVGTAVVAVMLMTSPAFAGSKACCSMNASERTACADLASLNLPAEQKTKIEAWQSDCIRGGCTRESRKTFLKQARGILSSEQFAKLKEQCKGSAKGKKIRL